jgi:lipopolysaccharide biosynthesis protein
MPMNAAAPDHTPEAFVTGHHAGAQPELMVGEARARAIAFYLPQYHPIPENDRFWGPGFTEWTNVAKARPLYRGHHQPRLPGELGFYDLRLPEVRERQAALARSSHIEGFCYWHYWFGGRRVLERPFNEVVAQGEPDLPFAVGWANESWSGIWHGRPDYTLLEQVYPGPDDHRRHFATLEAAFHDPRYLRVAGRPLFFLYRPFNIPDLPATLELWREMARSSGLNGLYIAGQATPWELRNRDASALDARVLARLWLQAPGRLERTANRLRRRPWVVDYRTAWKEVVPETVAATDIHPTVVPNWDNTPRSGPRGRVFAHTSPDLYRRQLERAVDLIAHKPRDERLVFIKSWNEWAEGNYLEPDLEHGSGWLDATRTALQRREA